jgi:RNA polymerase sigma-70 factor (ECF subfamily)
MNQQEFIKLYDKNVAAIYRYIFLKVSSKEVAQDLTSEVFLRAWNRLNADNPSEVKNPRAFLYQIARNLTVDFYRQKSRTEISLDNIEFQIPDLDDNPAEKANLGLELEPIRSALGEIKTDYAEVIIWHYLDELTVPEIADILDKTEGAVRVMLSRALEKIRDNLEEK